MGWIQKYDIDDESLPVEIDSGEEFESSPELEEIGRGGFGIVYRAQQWSSAVWSR